jgi:hypothetical protein
MPVHVAGQVAPEEKDLVFAEKEEMDGDREFCVHGFPT